LDKNLSAITGHIWFDTEGRAAFAVHLGRQHITRGFHECYWGGIKYQQAE